MCKLLVFGCDIELFCNECLQDLIANNNENCIIISHHKPQINACLITRSQMMKQLCIHYFLHNKQYKKENNNNNTQLMDTLVTIKRKELY